MTFRYKYYLGKEDYGSTSSPSELDLDVAMEEMIRLRKTIDTSVKENVSVAQERQKKQYNHRHLAGEYEVMRKIAACSSI